MTRRNRWSWTRRRHGIGLVGLVLLYAFGGWPRGALAACGTFDPMACMDGAFYNNVLIPALEWLWVGARGWLILARIVEGVRTWLVTDVLSLAFDAIIAGIQFPFWIAALLATIVFAVAFALQGLVEGLHWVQVKRAVKYLALAVFLFNVGSPAVAASEHLRLAVGQGFAQIAGSSASQTSVTFYADDDSSMDAPHTIYGGETDCPGMSVVREDPAMYLNDYTANYLWATAADIHCPSYADGSPQVPDAFARRYLPPEGQPIEDQEPDERKRLIGLAWSGIGRLVMGTILAMGATIEQALQLIYALALQAIWLGIFLSLLFVLFAPMEGVFQGQISSLKRLYFASWRAAFFLGLAMTLLYQAAQAGNGLLVAGFGCGTVVLALWQTWVAGKVGGAAIDSFGQTLGMAPQAISGAAKGIGGGVLGGAVTDAALASGFGLPAAVGIGNAAKRSPGHAAFRWAMMRQRYGRQAARREDAEERREAAGERAERADARQDRRFDLDEARNAREQEAHEWQRQDRARGGAWYEDGGAAQPGTAASPASPASGTTRPAEPAPTPEAQAEMDAIIALLRTPAPGDPGTGAAHATTARQTPAPAGSDPARPDQQPARGEQPATELEQPTRPGEADDGQAATPRSDQPDRAQPGGASRTQPHDRTLDPPTPDRDEPELADRPASADASADAQMTQGENAPQAVGGSRSPVHRDDPRTATPGSGPAPDPAPTPAPPATAPDRHARRAPHRIMTLAGRTSPDRPATGGTPRVPPHLTTPRSATRRPAGPPASGGLPTSGTLPPTGGSTEATTRPAGATYPVASPGPASTPAVVAGNSVPAGPAAAPSGPVSTPPAVTGSTGTGTSAAQAAGPARPNTRSVRPATTTRPVVPGNPQPTAPIVTGASVIDAARAPITGSGTAATTLAPVTAPRTPTWARPWAERARQRGTRQRTPAPAASASDDPSRVT